MPKTLYINGRAVKAVAVNGQNVKAIGDGVNTLWEQAQTDYFYIENLADSANTVTLPKTGSEREWVRLEYSLDKTNWDDYDLETGVSVPVGGKLYLRGNNNKLAYDPTNCHTFVSTGNIGAGGKAISLLSADLSANTVGNRAFQCLFMGNTNLIRTSTTLFDGIVTTGTYSFNQVFSGCTNLQNVCAFANITTATANLFTQTYLNCTSITTASAFLPNTTSATGAGAFAECFKGCTSLTTPPSFANLVASSASNLFSAMFQGCTALTTTPSLTIYVSGANMCQNMFQGCTALEDARNLTLSATTLWPKQYYSMFYNCSNLRYLPTFPTTAITLNTSSMENMFGNASITNTAYLTVPTITFGQPASGAAKGAYQMFLKSGLTNGSNITINCTADPNNNFARFTQMCTHMHASPHFNFDVLTTWDALRNLVNQTNNVDLIYGNVPQMGAMTNQWTYSVYSTGVFCKNSTLVVTRNTQDAVEADCDYIPYAWSIADLNGKLYAPVITENNGTITIMEAEGGQSCQLYYTTDGTTPTTNSTLYTQPFIISSGDVVKAIAHYAGASAALVTDSDVSTLVNQPTLSYSNKGTGGGVQEICTGYGYQFWKSRIKTTGIEGVTYYINYKNSATSDSYPSDPTTTVYDLTATYNDPYLSEADSEVLVQFNVCDADLVGDYLNIAVIGVVGGNVSEVAYLSMDFNRQ